MKTLQFTSITFFIVLLFNAGTLFGGLEVSTGVSIIENKNGAGVTLLAKSENNREFTITLNCELDNAVAANPLPVTVDSAGKMQVAVIRLRVLDPELPWHYKYTFHWMPGARRKATTNDALYALPFSSDEPHLVSQGNFGSFSHSRGSQDEYAVDWQVPIGTTICAARAGVVTGVRQNCTTGGIGPIFKNQANYVIIKHEDGTFAEHLHLDTNGALVKIGDKVTVGQPIARSGNTGHSDRPHLHFSVFQTIDGNTRLSLPTRYQTKQGIRSDLEQGKRY